MSDFTTYFNRFYNSKKAFEDAEEAMAGQERELFSFQEEKIPSAANQKFESVIEKCSNILQFDPNSAYVSDALFMIGQSFYYQQNYSKALRKFRELSAKNDEDFTLTNNLWIGKTELKIRNFDEGFEILDTVKINASLEDENEILVDASISQISFLIYRENYERAILFINELLEVSDSDELNAEVMYELGNLYYEIDSLSLASQAYLDVDDYSPTFAIQFDSKLKFAEVNRKLGSTEEALEFLDDLRYENKFQNDRDRVEVEIALIYLEQGNVDEAESMLIEVDSVYSKKPSAGVASYNLGLIQENYYKDLDSASYYYEKVMRVQNVPLEVKDDARKKNRLLSKYGVLVNQLEKQEIQYLYLMDNTKFLQDSIDYNYLQIQKREENNKKNFGQGSAQVVEKMDAISENPSATDAQTDSTVTSDSVSTDNFAMDLEYSGNIVKYKPLRPKMTVDSLNSMIARSKYDLANLFLTEFEVADSAYLYYNSILNDYPDGPMTAKTLFALGSYNLTLGDSVKADSLFQYVYDNYPEDEIAIEAARRLGRATDSDDDVAERMFKNAEDNFLNENYSESIDTLYQIYGRFPNSDYAPKSLYTIGYLFANEMDMMDSAIAVYDTLSIKYQRSEYTLKISAPLRVYEQESKRIQDSLSQIIIADSLYADSVNAASLGLSDSLGIADSSVVVDSTSISDSLAIPDSIKANFPEEDNNLNPNILNEEDDDLDPKKINENESSNNEPDKKSATDPSQQKPPIKEPQIDK